MSIHSRIEQPRFEDTIDEAVVGLLLVAGAIENRLEAACEEHGITAAQYNVLRILRGVHPTGHPRCEIARRLISRAPDVTRLVDRLERQGLVERHWDPANRRLSIARITRHGLDLLDRLDPLVRRIQHEALAPLAKRDVDALARILNQMVP